MKKSALSTLLFILCLLPASLINCYAKPNIPRQSANSTYLGKSCPSLAVWSDATREDFLKYLTTLQKAAKSHDCAALSKLVIYPLNVYQAQKSKKLVIHNSTQFKKNCSVIITPAITQTIVDQPVDDIFCRDQGAMLDVNGYVWISKPHGKIGIISIIGIGL